MSKKIEAPTLEEAYRLASKELGCSITELEVEIVQNPSKGFLGIGKKNAIILASCKKEKEAKEAPIKTEGKAAESTSENSISKETQETEKKDLKDETPLPSQKVAPMSQEPKESKEPKKKEQPQKKAEERPKRVLPKIDEEFSNFYKDSESIEEIATEVERELNELFSHSCFRLERVKVSPYDENTLLIEFSGEDSALLIGKEGYRYKALSYMLFNWINSRYSLQIRLEIAEFLKTQEEMIRNYLKPVIERIKNEGSGKTKPLDGVLVQIALRELRAAFPDKYVAIRTNRQGEKFIIVNNFRRNENQ